MSIEPIASVIVATGQVQLPHALERQLIQVVTEGLAAIAIVRPDIVQIEQDAAIRGFGDASHKFTVG